MKVLRGREERAPLFGTCDVVVVGSGAGGAVVAKELSAAGLSVIVLEEGGHYTPEEYGAMPPTESLRRLAREAGLAIAFGIGKTPAISLLSGKCVGGSSVLTGGVCFRIPEAVLASWERSEGLSNLSPRLLEPHFEAIERELHVHTVPPSMRSRSTELFVAGAEKLGVTMKSLRRNTRGCKGASRCTFGCPNEAKLSVDRVHIPEALRHGAIVLSDALATRIEHSGGVARGVRGRLLHQDSGEPKIPFHIRARAVVVACGALHTPLLFLRSRMGLEHAGKHLTLHPAFRIGAMFEEDVLGWDGAMQSVYSDAYAEDGVTLVGAYSSPNILAATFPGFGARHRDLVSDLRRTAIFGGMVHDEAGGRVRRWVSREPFITYRMAERDIERVLFGIRTLAEMAFAAGAKKVVLPIFGTEPIASPTELAGLSASRFDTRKIECFSFHPLGSARMSADPHRGVVNPSGEAWDVRNLFVADGSILPTSIGVNSQIPVMTLARYVSHEILARWPELMRRAA